MKSARRRFALILALLLCLAVPAFAKDASRPSAGGQPDILGRIDGSRYENIYAGLGCDLPGWTYRSEKEIAELYEVTVESLAEKVADLVDQSAQVMVMLCASPAGFPNVNMILFNAAADRAVLEAVGLRPVLEANMETYRRGFEQSGYEVSRMEVVDRAVGGEVFPAYRLEYRLSGVDLLCEVAYILRGDVCSIVTATARTAEDIDRTFGAFFLLP